MLYNGYCILFMVFIHVWLPKWKAEVITHLLLYVDEKLQTNMIAIPLQVLQTEL